MPVHSIRRLGPDSCTVVIENERDRNHDRADGTQDRKRNVGIHILVERNANHSHASSSQVSSEGYEAESACGVYCVRVDHVHVCTDEYRDNSVSKKARGQYRRPDGD